MTPNPTHALDGGVQVRLDFRPHWPAASDVRRWAEKVTIPMKRLLCLALFSFVGLPSAFAKVDVQLQNCAVESVTNMGSKIVFVVSGRCLFFLAAPTGKNVRETRTLLYHAVVTIKRNDMSEARSPDEKQRRWKELCDKADALRSKKIWMDCEHVTLVIEDNQVNYLTCMEANFGDEDAPNPQGGANGRQPSSSETNRTSAAAASRRSP